jgi:hypothetical protein
MLKYVIVLIIIYWGGKFKMRKDVYLIIAFLISISVILGLYLYFISCKNSEVTILKKELLSLKVNTPPIPNKTIESEKKFIDDENFKWVGIKNWDVIKVTNPIVKDKIEIKDTTFISHFDLYNILSPLTYRFSPSEITPHNVQPYIYEFIKDNKTYTLSVVGDNLVKIGDRYYNTNNNIEGLGDAFLPSPTYLEVNNIFAKIYYSGMYKFNKEDYSFDKRHINLFAEYFFLNHLEKLKCLPQEIMKLSSTLTFYWHKEEIILYLYENKNKVQYIKLQDNKNTYYFKQLDSHYSILNIMGI